MLIKSYGKCSIIIYHLCSMGNNEQKTENSSLTFLLCLQPVMYPVLKANKLLVFKKLYALLLNCCITREIMLTLENASLNIDGSH